MRKHRGNIYNELDDIQNTLIKLLDDTIKIRKEIEEVLIYYSYRENELENKLEDTLSSE